MRQNVLLFLLASLSVLKVNSNIIPEEGITEESEGDSARFWGGDCQVDLDCLRLEVSQVQLQVSVCQSSKERFHFLHLIYGRNCPELLLLFALLASNNQRWDINTSEWKR